MTEHVSAPELNVVLPYDHEHTWGVQKFFTAPDFVQLYTDKENDWQGISWATEFSGVDSVHALHSFIQETGFKKGRILLKAIQERPETTGVNELAGKIEDVLHEIEDSQDRVSMYELTMKGLRLNWHRSLGFNFHSLPTDQISVMAKRGNLSRSIVAQCMTATARPDLSASIEQTLDEFAAFEPSFGQ